MLVKLLAPGVGSLWRVALAFSFKRNQPTTQPYSAQPLLSNSRCIYVVEAFWSRRCSCEWRQFGAEIKAHTCMLRSVLQVFSMLLNENPHLYLDFILSYWFHINPSVEFGLACWMPNCFRLHLAPN